MIKIEGTNEEDRKATISWAQAIERYFEIEKIILYSNSWKEAEEEIEKIRTNNKKRGYEMIYYGDNSILWKEYQFLLFCQLIEYKLAELMTLLYKRGLIKLEFIEKLKKNKKIDKQKISSDIRIISADSLIADLGYTLGELIEIINNNCKDFILKDTFIHNLNDFNKHRISFIHHSFTTDKKAGLLSLEEILGKGKDSGTNILRIYYQIFRTI
jgi:hypothetical protein